MPSPWASTSETPVRNKKLETIVRWNAIQPASRVTSNSTRPTKPRSHAK